MRFGYREGIVVVLEIFLFGLAYGMSIFIIWSYLKLFGKKLTKIFTLATLCLFGFCLILMIIIEFSTEIGYGGIYMVFISIFGILIHMFVFCVIYQLITLCVKNLKIWIGLIIILIIPGLYCIYGYVIPKIIKTERVTIYHEKFVAGQQTTILHLSDVHIGAVYQEGFVKSIVKKINEYKPDVVVITGDLFDGSIEVKEKWFEPFQEVDVKIYFVMGNHDTEHYGREKILKVLQNINSNIIYLEKGNKIYKFNKDINFIGIDYDEDLFESLGKMQDELVTNGKINILLLHVPQDPKKFKDYNIFLTLSGHTHNGQLFPGNLMSYIWFSCVNGLYKVKDGDFYTYVSSGIGDTFFPMRTFTRSKIVLITIKGK